MKNRRAIVASYGVPEPDRDTGSRRVFDLVQMLNDAGWDVSFVALHGITRRSCALELQQRGIPVYGKRPSDHLGSTAPLEEALATGPCDLCLLAFWPLAERLMPVIRRLSPHTRIVVDSIDLHFLRDARRILQPLDGNGTAPAAVLDAWYASQLTGELNTYAAADAVLTVSEKEATLINDLTGQLNLAYNVGLVEDQEWSKRPFRRRSGILTVGNYAHLPNLQAVEYLCHDVLPHLDPKLAAAHPVYVVGSGLEDAGRRLEKTSPHVRIVGWVPSMRPYLEQSRIAVVPLRYGAGAKGKVIEALMAGTPLVSSSIGTEGLGLRDREHLLVADDASAFAEAMTELLTNEGLWKSIARRGRQHVVRLHGRATIAKQFLTVVDEVLHAEPKPAILKETTESDYRSRLHYQEVPRVKARLLGAVTAHARKEAVCAVVTGGEDWLLELGGQPVVRFPDPDERARAEGRSPGDIAIEDLEKLRSGGAEFLVVPSRALWWLDRVKEFKTYLEGSYQGAVQKDCCVIYPLRTEPVADVEIATAEASGEKEVPSERRPRPPSSARLIAFYLPQFHPIPENDAWWGQGFTEWTSVSKARPLFPGHAQPSAPADLGFCDLRLPETRSAQAKLAREYGIYGFCYYHYWFNGKRLLERPFNEVLASGAPDLPFCLCWVNEPWSRRWDGSSHDVLQEQPYSPEDDEAHMAWLLPALKDPRTITVDGKPLFLVYQARDLPEPARTVALWRRMVAEAGLSGIHLVAVETGWDAGWDATQVGFDAKVLFQPQFSILKTVPQLDVEGPRSIQVYDYSSAWPTLAHPEPVAYPRYDTVFPGWDNSPRAGERAVVVHGSTPAAYEAWLSLAIDRAASRPPDHQLVFINAWNEWGEGCHLEPDVLHGRAYLEATRKALGPSALESSLPQWDFPHADAGSLTPEEAAEALTGFEERVRGWAASQVEPAPSNLPAISVEVPVSKGNWLMPCIESVLKQSSPLWHLYLLWDHGNDLSRRILKIVEALNHPKITVLFNRKRGTTKPRELLSAASTEDYILPMDEDEMLQPKAVEALLAAAAEKPWFAIIRARRTWIDEQGHVVADKPSPPFADRAYQHGMVKDLDNYSRPYLVSRRAYLQTDGWKAFEELHPGGEDCDLYLKLEEKGTIELLDLPIHHSRMNGHAHQARPPRGSESWRRLADRTIDRIGLPIRRVDDAPPFTYERIARATPDLSQMDVVIASYESDEKELSYCNSRVLASKEFVFVKLSEVLTFTQPIKADLFPCDRVELTCVLLTPFESTLSIRVRDPKSRAVIAQGSTELRYEQGPGLVTVKVSLENKRKPVSRVLECTISCTASGKAGDSFSLVLQESDEGERVAAMRLFRRSPGFSRRMLDRCVKSIKACGVPDDAIHVIRKKQSSAVNRNEGYARTARPYVCFADDDIEIVDKQTFTKLLRAMAETDAAVIGPRLITDIGSIFCADPYFDEHLHPKPRGLGEPTGSQYQYRREVPWLPSTLLICRSEAIRVVSGFDEGYIGSQMEDVDFCLKVRQRDLKCVYDGTVDVVHYNYQRNDRFTENYARFAGRWRGQAALLDSVEDGKKGKNEERTRYSSSLPARPSNAHDDNG